MTQFSLKELTQVLAPRSYAARSDGSLKILITSKTLFNCLPLITLYDSRLLRAYLATCCTLKIKRRGSCARCAEANASSSITKKKVCQNFYYEAWAHGVSLLNACN